MSLNSPLQISRGFLAATGTRIFLHYPDRIPAGGAALIISNHRSFMDAPLLMNVMGHPIRFACHHYMAQVPILREFVNQLGCLPLAAHGQQQHRFFRQAIQVLQRQEMVGVFPEGASPMVRLTDPRTVGKFHPGFAHLALSARVQDLAVIPVAIAPFEEVVHPGLPVQVLSLFDPSEPHFKQEGSHPLVIYRRVNVFIGRPQWITPSLKQSYHGQYRKTLVNELTAYAQTEIADLLRQGFY